VFQPVLAKVMADRHFMPKGLNMIIQRGLAYFTGVGADAAL
jgi:hypothetical protein